MATSTTREFCCLLIPDADLQRGIGVEWGCGNNLLVYASRKPLTLDQPSISAPCSPLIHDINWNVVLHNKHVRKLVNESHSIFVSLQKSSKSNTDWKEHVVKLSRKYRSVLSACIFDLEQASEKVDSESVKDDLCAQGELFSTIELIWHLCEILFVDKQSATGGAVLNQLLEWIHWHFTESDKKAEEAMQYKMPQDHEVYWEAIYCYILQGKLDLARKLLKQHSSSFRDDFLSLDELLEKMPIYHHQSQMVQEFNLRWRHWQDECRRRLENGEFASLSELEIIARILCGDKKVFLELSELCGTWYHMMVSQLLYTNPCIQSHCLRTAAKESIDLFGGQAEMQDVDKILLSAMELDLMEVITEICYFPDGWWFLAHFVDLLRHVELKEYEDLSYFPRLREFVLLNYAAAFMSHSSLWQVGVDYLDSCSRSGRCHLELYLERIPIKSEAKAWKLLEIAEKRDMKQLAGTICKSMGLRSLKAGNIGTALMWAVKAQDTSFASYLADKFLTKYSETGEFSNLDLLDNLGSCMLVSERLTFLGKYREFHKLYEEKEFKSAASLLVSLLASNLAPKDFWMTILLDALPLLEAKDVIFSSQQTYRLLYFLEELVGEQVYTNHKKEAPITKDQADLLRLAIARNLARSFIEEGTTA